MAPLRLIAIALTAVLTTALPAIGAAALLVLIRRTGSSAWLTGGAVACFIAGLALTALVHFPLNDQILGWSPGAPPSDWQQLRDQWTSAHTARVLLSATTLVLLLLGALRPAADRAQPVH